MRDFPVVVLTIWTLVIWIVSGAVYEHFRDSERVTVPPWMYEYADQQCEDGFRKITVTEESIGVHCWGGGLHVLDWAARRAE